MKDIPIETSPYLPKGEIFFYDPDVPEGLTFESIEEKLTWMAQNGRLTVMVNVVP